MINFQYSFFIINALYTLYLLFFRLRKLDFLTIYILTLFLYTLPLFFGVVSNPYTRIYDTPTPDIYVVMSIPYIISSFFILFFKNNLNYKGKESPIKEKISLQVFMYTSIISVVLYLPTLLASSNKVELLENSNLFYSTLYSYLPVAGFLLAVKLKKRRFIVFFSLILVFVLIFGGRKSATTAFLAAAIIVMQHSPLRLISKYKFLLSALTILIVLILSKTLYGYTLYYGAREGFTAWIDNFELRYIFIGSEFLSTSTILNSVLAYDFHTDKIYYLYSFLALLPIPLSVFDYSSSYFNDQFQPVLFPGIEYGMAYNIWADAYAAYGYFGILFISILIPGLLSILWTLYSRSKPVLSILFLLIGVTFAFWVHRNSLASIFAYIRNIIYPLIAIYILIKILTQFFMQFRK